MDLKGKTVGFAITGSFCTFSKVFPQIEEMVKKGAESLPIMSEISYSTDTRFGKAKDHIEFLEKVTGNKVISKIPEAEPIGPKKMLDALITNFHLPESTLLMLVSALYDRENIMNAYHTAVEEKYRFFSFGDAMFIC